MILKIRHAVYQNRSFSDKIIADFVFRFTCLRATYKTFDEYEKKLNHREKVKVKLGYIIVCSKT